MDKKRFDMLQYNMKILANSFYGNTGTPISRFYFPPISMSITLFGQEMIKRCKEVLNRHGYEILYSDSVTGDSKILITKDGKEFNHIPIMVLYQYLNGPIVHGIDGKEYKIVNDDIYTPTFNEKTGKIELKKILKIMKHKCQKKVYEIKIDNIWKIKVTEDHSIYTSIFNEKSMKNEIVCVKPHRDLSNLITIYGKQFLAFDNIINYDSKLDYSIKSIYQINEINNFKDYVYDIEVEDNHNFFANFILVHNTDSTFINVDPLIPEEVKKSGDDNKIIDYIYTEIVPKLYEVINPELDKLAEEYNIKEHRFAMKQEIVGKRLIFFYKRDRKEDEILSAKKRYIAWIVDEEGEKKDELLVRGLEIRRSELSKDIKDRVKSIYEYILKTSDNEETIKKNIIEKSLELKKQILEWIKNLEIDKVGININIKDLLTYKGNTPQYKGLINWNIIASLYGIPEVFSVIKGKLLYIKLLKNKSSNKIFNYIVKEKPKVPNPSRGGKKEMLTPNKFDSLVISPEVYGPLSKEIKDEIWAQIKIDEDRMLDRIFYGPLTPIFDLFNIKKEDLLIGDL